MQVSLILMVEVSKDVESKMLRLFNILGGLDHLEATKGRLRKLEAGFESFYGYNGPKVQNSGLPNYFSNLGEFWKNFAKHYQFHSRKI